MYDFFLFWQLPFSFDKTSTIGRKQRAKNMKLMTTCQIIKIFPGNHWCQLMEREFFLCQNINNKSRRLLSKEKWFNFKNFRFAYQQWNSWYFRNGKIGEMTAPFTKRWRIYLSADNKSIQRSMWWIFENASSSQNKLPKL